MTVAGGTRDLDVVHDGLVRWLQARRPDAGDVRVAPLRKPSSGYSSETLLVDASWQVGGTDHETQLVARLPPAGGGIFPTYDLTLQARVQEALTRTSIPVARPVAVELDEEWVGAPFFLMERVAGRVLDDAPSYVAGGLLHDAPAQTQHRVQRAFVHTLADIHLLDWEALGLGSLTPAGARGLVHDVDRALEYVSWAADGDAPTVLTDALQWCLEQRPDPEPPLSLVWGDPRLGNVVFDDAFNQTGLLDWEMASIGVAEMDVAWFMGLHEVSAEGHGADLPGFEPHDAALATYAERAGRSVVDYRWFEVFSLVRADAIFLRIRRMLLASGLDQPWLRGATPGQERVARLIA